MNYCYGKGVQKSVLCWEVVPFSESPLSEVPLYSLRIGVYLQLRQQRHLRTSVKVQLNKPRNQVLHYFTSKPQVASHTDLLNKLVPISPTHFLVIKMKLATFSQLTSASIKKFLDMLLKGKRNPSIPQTNAIVYYHLSGEDSWASDKLTPQTQYKHFSYYTCSIFHQNCRHFNLSIYCSIMKKTESLLTKGTKSILIAVFKIFSTSITIKNKVIFHSTVVLGNLESFMKLSIFQCLKEDEQRIVIHCRTYFHNLTER